MATLVAKKISYWGPFGHFLSSCEKKLIVTPENKKEKHFLASWFVKVPHFVVLLIFCVKTKFHSFAKKKNCNSTVDSQKRSKRYCKQILCTPSKVLPRPPYNYQYSNGKMYLLPTQSISELQSRHTCSHFSKHAQLTQ